MGGVIECGMDKLRPPQQQISPGQELQRVVGRPPSVHAASSSSGR